MWVLRYVTHYIFQVEIVNDSTNDVKGNIFITFKIVTSKSSVIRIELLAVETFINKTNGKGIRAGGP